MTDDPLGLLDEVAVAVATALGGVRDLGPSGRREGQYVLDLAADDAALAVLSRAGVGVLSEESGFLAGRHDAVVVIDPVDGSTNASRGIPWYATACCLVDAHGPRAALVVNQATGRRWWAERGSGAHNDRGTLRATAVDEPGSAIAVVNGLPPSPLGTRQVRMFGAAALDLCLVAEGAVDAYVDCDVEALGVWDYLAAALVCAESGATVLDAFGRDLLTFDHAARRTPVASGSTRLASALAARRREYADPTRGA